jgi:hypothetical protein
VLAFPASAELLATVATAVSAAGPTFVPKEAFVSSSVAEKVTDCAEWLFSVPVRAHESFSAVWQDVRWWARIGRA